MTNHWIHMDPEIFPNPQKFEPSRWLGDSEKTKLMYSYFVPFSKGSRACLAKNLVDMLIYHTLYRLYGPNAPRIELYETDESSIRLVHGLLFSLPRLDSPGVRAYLVDDSASESAKRSET
ncbi:cytochrome P450 [Aspergillus granulosus]|uniref:Cytochrome P450 n=1 Tax=Aspergillus granulosus TaxID=176169 RepID=A0ABR4GYJ8_9EURO